MSRLEHAFAATHYGVYIDARWHTIFIGDPCPDALRAWLAKASAAEAWLVTAYNPAARASAHSANERRDAVLRRWAKQRGLSTLSTVHRDPDGRWPDEHGLLIAGLNEHAAHALGRRLGQIAVVHIDPALGAQLVWL